jgi:hypothetical protein
MFFDSPNGKRFMTEKSKFICFGPRRTLDPTFPKSVPVSAAVALPFELGINWPASCRYQKLRSAGGSVREV